MTDPEKIKRIEEQITITGLLPGVNLDCMPPEELAKIKRALLDIYRLSHARGFKAGVEHMMSSIAGHISQRDAAQTQRMKRWSSARMRKRWQSLKKWLRSIRATVTKNQRPRRFPTESLSGNWAVRR